MWWRALLGLPHRQTSSCTTTGWKSKATSHQNRYFFVQTEKVKETFESLSLSIYFIYQYQMWSIQLLMWHLCPVLTHFWGFLVPSAVCCCQDPHGELQGQNVLIVRYSVELTAAHFGITVEKVVELLASARARMAEVRKSRPRPHLDTKMLASWNGKV